MFMSKCKSNRIPYLALSIITFVFFSGWPCILKNMTPENWVVWRLLLIACVLYLGFVYFLTGEHIYFPIVYIIYGVAICWSIIVVVLAVFLYIFWQVPVINIDMEKINFIIIFHMAISIISTVGAFHFYEGK